MAAAASCSWAKSWIRQGCNPDFLVVAADVRRRTSFATMMTRKSHPTSNSALVSLCPARLCPDFFRVACIDPPPALDTSSTFRSEFATKLRVRSDLLKNVTRIVVKLGTGVLTDSRKQPDLAQMEQLVAQIAEQRKAGKEIVLVSSGAVGAGMGVLGHEIGRAH